MQDQYQSHLIEAVARPKPDSDRWVVHVTVSWGEGDSLRIQPFAGPIDGFQSEQEAASYGIQLGRKWD